MDDRLVALVRAYQERVAWTVERLEEVGIPRPASTTEWVGNGIEQQGTLADGGRYYKHGYGIAVHGGDGVVVDFDFGDSGEITGFNVSRLWGFSAFTPHRCGFTSEAELKRVFDLAVGAGELRYSGYILYYLQPAANV